MFIELAVNIVLHGIGLNKFKFKFVKISLVQNPIPSVTNCHTCCHIPPSEAKSQLKGDGVGRNLYPRLRHGPVGLLA